LFPGDPIQTGHMVILIQKFNESNGKDEIILSRHPYSANSVSTPIFSIIIYYNRL